MKTRVCLIIAFLSIASCSDKVPKSGSTVNASANIQDLSKYESGEFPRRGDESIRFDIKINDSLFEYIITNNTEESYFTWIDFHPIEESYCHRVESYFNTPHGDSSLLQLLTGTVNENSLFLSPLIGTFFLKEITPNSSFKYIVEPLEKESYLDFIRFVYLLKEDDNMINGICNRQFLWPKDSVLVKQSDQKKGVQ